MRSVFRVFCLCVLVAGCSGAGSTGLPPLPDGQVPPPSSALSPTGPAPAPTARPGPVTASNPSTAIVDVNRSNPAQLGPNSPPPTSFENSCAPAPYLFQSKAGYEAVRVKDCKNDQLVYLPSSAQTQINIYVEDCQRRCGAR
jgi:hypothetical protein